MVFEMKPDEAKLGRGMKIQIFLRNMKFFCAMGWSYEYYYR